MINNKALPNLWYATSAFVCAAATFAILWPRHMNSNDIALLLFTVGITTVISVKTGIYIKTYKKVDSEFLDVLVVCAIPVYMYLSLRLVGYSKCLKCISIALIMCLVYTSILIKVNIADHHKFDNKRYLNKVIATGIYNIRFIVLMILVIQMLLISHNRENNQNCYVKYAAVRFELSSEQTYSDSGLLQSYYM